MKPLPVLGAVMQTALRIKRDVLQTYETSTVTTPLEEVRHPVPALTRGQRAGETSVLSSA